MNFHQQKKSEDGKSILKLRIKNGVVVCLYLAVNEDIDAIEDIITELDTRTPEQSEDTSGVTEDKETAGVALATIIDWHAQITCSYFMRVGDMTNNNKLKNYKLYKLKKMKPAELKMAAATTSTICTAFLTELLKFRITALTIDKIATANTAYAPLSNEPKEVRQKTKLNTASIKELIKMLTHIINFRLRGSLKAMEELHPDLYAQFYELTFEDKIGAHSHFLPSVVTGTIYIKAVDSITGQPLEGVSFRGVGFTEVVVTDSLGMGLIELPIGTQTIKFIFFDYLGTQITMDVLEEDMHADVVMVMGTGSS